MSWSTLLCASLFSLYANFSLYFCSIPDSIVSFFSHGKNITCHIFYLLDTSTTHPCGVMLSLLLLNLYVVSIKLETQFGCCDYDMIIKRSHMERRRKELNNVLAQFKVKNSRVSKNWIKTTTESKYDRVVFMNLTPPLSYRIFCCCLAVFSSSFCTHNI